MKVPLGKFARTGIEDRLGADLGVVVQAAIHHFVRRLGSHWQPIESPRFMDTSLEGGEFLELTVGSDVEMTLEREAERRGVPLDDLLRHAVLVYLADLDLADSSEGQNVVGRSFIGASADSPLL